MSGFLEVGGTRLEYAWHGPAPEHAPTLVFLHEGLGSVSMWRDFPARVGAATGCGVLVYSRAGYGRSDSVSVPRPLTYMHTEALDVLPRVLDAAGVCQAVLIGHSDGGSIALINAGGAGDGRVLAVAALAPHVFNEEASVTGIRAAREAYETTALRERLARHHQDVDGAFWGWNRAWLDPDFLDWNIEEYLPGIRVPLLLIQGDRDEYGTAAQLEAIERQTAGPVSTVWFADCGHSAHKDKPEATLEALRDFVAKALGRTRTAASG